MAQQTATSVNGVDVSRLVGTIEAVKANPALAKFTFRAVTEWVSGGHSQTKVHGFYGAGQEDSSRARPFILAGDEPPVLLGQNRGANAVETLLHALSSCLAVGLVYNASALGIRVESLTFKLKGDLDLHAFLGISDRTRPGYENIRVTCHLQTDAPPEKIAELWEHVQRTSPVLDIIRNPVPVTLALEN